MKRTDHSQDSGDAKTILDYYFDSEPDSRLHDDIRDWFEADVHRENKDAALKEIWDRTVCYDPHPDKYAYSSYREMRVRLGFPPETPVAKRFSLRRVAVRAAAALVPLLFAAGAVYLSLRNPADLPETGISAPETTLVSQTEEKAVRRRVVLPDGSEVWVFRNSTISYPENFDRERVVYLDGEAYFSVVKQDGKPFVVQGKDLSVRVLGTEFIMRSYVGDTPSEVILSSGSVEVTAQDKTVLMQPEQRLVYDAQAEDIYLKTIAKEQIAPWKGLHLNFENEPLKNVFSRIADYYGVALAIDDRLALDPAIRVKIEEDEPLDEVLYIIRQTIGTFDFSMNRDTVVITAK